MATRPTSAQYRSRRTALLVLCAGILMIILDGTIVNVALPSIQRDLHFSQSGLTWVVNSYLIAFGSLLLLAGRLGDRFGSKRIFVIGLAVFTAASALCGLADDPALLIAARFVQGASGALASAVGLGMIVTLFPEPREQAKAIGAYSFVGSAGASIGVIGGGVLTQVLTWHWIFFVNLPIGAVAAFFAVRVLESPDRTEPRAEKASQGNDSLGSLLVTAALMIAVYTIVKAADYGWGSARTLGLGAVAIVLLGGFVVREHYAAHPLLPLRILRSRTVAGANLVQALMVAAMIGFQFLFALYLQQVLGFDAMRTGLGFLPITIAIGVLSLLLSARLNARFGVRRVLMTSLVFLGAGLAALTQVSAHADYFTDLMPILVLLGVGAGMALPAVTTLAMSDATPADSGLVSGLANTTQQVGGALGLAVLSTLATERSGRLGAQGAAARDALTGGFHLAFGVGAGLMAVAFVLSARSLRSDAESISLPMSAQPAPSALR